MISVVTPWLNASELCGMYAKGLQGAQIIAVDNASEPEHAQRIKAMAEESGGIYIRNETNLLFATANNQGLDASTGDIVLFLNNDVECRNGFLEQVERDVQPGGLYGPSMLYKHGLGYLEGWCIAARREVFTTLDGWDDKYYSGLYWEDNDLCARAQAMGYELVTTHWSVWHFNNYTTRQTPGATASYLANEAKFVERLKSWQPS